MKKHFTKFVFTFLTIVLLGQVGVSQTYIWGGPGDKNSEFNGGLNDWVVNAVSPNDSAVWIWNAEGKADKGSFFGNAVDPAIFSPSASNGAAVFDSDYLSNGGDYFTNNDPYDGIAPAPQTGELISPTFSCEEYDNVWVQFYQFHRNFNSSTKIAISKDGGQTWETSIEVNADIPQYYITNGIKLINISAYAARESNVKIKFIWEGSYYFWILDDVSVISGPTADPQITGTWFPPQYFNTPQCFILADSLRFKMAVQNKGGAEESKDILGKVTLVHIPTSETYFSDSVRFDLAAEEEDTITFKSFIANSIEEMDTGYYRAVYEIVDTTAATDHWKRFVQVFRVSPNMFVEKLDNGDSLFMNSYTTSDDDIEGYNKLGKVIEAFNINVYRTAEWTKNDYVSIVASDVTMSLAIGEQEDNLEFDVDVSILKLADTVKLNLDNFNSDDGIDNDNPQLDKVGYSSEHLKDIPDRGTFSTPFYDGDDLEGVSLEPNSKYILSARWNTDQTYYQGFDNLYGRYPRYYFDDQLQYHVYTSEGFYVFTDVPGSAWDMGLILKLVVPNGDSGIDEENLLPANTVIIKENPVRDMLRVDVDFQRTIDKATMVIHDINGQIIDIRTVKDLNSGTFNFHTSNLPTGTYIFTIFTKDKLLSKKFVIAK